ncbi:MAG: alkaline phosphatase family protein [Flavobacteriales bacterium]|nr:alkaline phosphatase family protein [Flavobacteriales bacterium]
MRFPCSLLLAALPALCVAQTGTTPPSEPAWTDPPKLVVGIVVDQRRTDFIYRYWDNFGPGGFKRLIGEGAFLRNTHYTYIPTITGPGHASIYTGSVPAYHGIVANDRYDRATRKSIYCVRDTTVSGVGSATAQSAPSQLLATTLADEIERRTDGRGKTIGVALKDRSSVLPIGRTGDAAYWFSGNNFATSTWYMKELPRWVSEFNARKLPEKYIDRTWEPLLAIEKYHQVLPDENPYEQPLTSGAKSSFPYDLAQLAKGPVGIGLIASTPWGNTLTTDMALAALAGEQMGKDDITDLLALSYSSTDILGHKMGPRSLEIEDMYIRLDLELARLLTELDKSVGAGRYTVFLTADHGAVDVPAYLRDLKGSAGYLDPRAVQQRLHAAFNAISDERPLQIDTVIDGHVYFRSTPREGLLQRVVEEIAAMPEISMVMTAHAARRNTADGEQGLLANGYMPQRCGDILYTLKPGYFEAEGLYAGKGTTHGSGWNYDTHVPVLLFGQGIVHGEVVRRTAVADIVPTICMIVGCALTDAAVGEPVHEVLAR